MVPSQPPNVSVMPDYYFTLEFEKKFNHDWWIEFGTAVHHICVPIAISYLIAVFFLQELMRNRPALDLRKYMTLWNISLAVFSTVGALRSYSELSYTFRLFGFRSTYCNNDFIRENRIAVMWCILFLVSKAVELLDTFFVVLRKQKLTVLHWFHHSSVLVWSWYLGRDFVAMGRYFQTMNMTVHSFMYTYYALRSLRFRVPKFLAMAVTTAQITQMTVGFFISLLAFKAYFAGEECAITGRVVTMSVALYFAYFLLFANYFFKTYVYPILRTSHTKSS